MRHKLVYSRASGAIGIFAALVFITCFFDSARISSFYRNHIQPTFGTTHFIVGYNSKTAQSDYHDESTVPSLSKTQNNTHRILFSPDDDLQIELIKLINEEKKSIKIAIFTFTDLDVAQALIDAHEKGVKVEVVSDAAYLRDQYSKIALLQSHKIPIYTYNPHYQNVSKKKQEYLSIMHNKFVIFGNNGGNKALVWTGSFNFTRSAKLRNQENVVILDDISAVNKFTQQFDRLKRRCNDCYDEQA